MIAYFALNSLLCVCQSAVAYTLARSDAAMPSSPQLDRLLKEQSLTLFFGDEFAQREALRFFHDLRCARVMLLLLPYGDHRRIIIQHNYVDMMPGSLLRDFYIAVIAQLPEEQFPTANMHELFEMHALVRMSCEHVARLAGCKPVYAKRATRGGFRDACASMLANANDQAIDELLQKLQQLPEN